MLDEEDVTSELKDLATHMITPDIPSDSKHNDNNSGQNIFHIYGQLRR